MNEELKAKTLAVVSQQMANWVVDIQRQIAQNQGDLVKTLDELQESVARYDEKINEAEIEAAMGDIAIGGAPAGPGFDAFKASIDQIDTGANLSEVLTHLVDQAASYLDRAAIFIVKGPNAIGWYAKGVPAPDAVKQLNVPLSADTLFRDVCSSQAPVRGNLASSPGTAQVVGRLGGSASGTLAVPLILREKIAAILYCDTTQDEVPAAEADLVEVLVRFAGKTIDILSLAPKSANPKAAPRPAAPPPPTPPPPPPPPADEGSATVMFTPQAVQQIQQEAVSGLSPEDQKAHDDAKRFARLVVSEIKLYNEAKVTEGRRNKDIYQRLRDDIDRGRQMYDGRIPENVRSGADYFKDELVKILAGGDAGALGAM